MKELVIAGMLLAARDVIGGINWVQKEKENPDITKATEKAKKAFAGNEIEGKTLGIIGLGAIGVKVANAATHLGMNVLGYDPYISVDAAWNLSRSIKHIKKVEDIYSECDYITIHVPLTDGTRQMINQDAIDMMKDDVVVLNFSRDTLVDEDAMLSALENGKVKRYVTDFPNPKVANAKGVLVIPHLGASTEESEDNCAVMAVKELVDYMENGNINNSVNYPSCNMGVCSSVSRVAINHRNVKNMLGQFTNMLAEADVNITNMVNKSKGDYAYTLLDLETGVNKEVIDKLRAVDGVLKVRVIKK